MRLVCHCLILLALVGCAGQQSLAPLPPTALPATAQALRADTAVASPTLAAASATVVASATVAATATASATVLPTPSPLPAPQNYSLPIGSASGVPGDGFFIRHGYVAENTWYNPGYWHTGEDWYALEGDTAGAQIYAIAGGTVVYAGANYPGRVVIVEHEPELFSMYGHLDPALGVEVGQQLARGELIGTVLRRGDQVPNHLHFELRSFLTTNQVNGDAPRYPFRCGPRCPPGPGYWPGNAPDHPGELGWRNPLHGIASRATPGQQLGGVATAVVATSPFSASVTLWGNVAEDGKGQGPQGELLLQPGERFPLLAVLAGPEDSRGFSAQSYTLWYQLRLPDDRSGWVQAAVPSTSETGSDGRASSVHFNFYREH